VPEATINKDRDLAFGKYDVWPDTEAILQVEPVVLPETITKSVQRATQSDLWLGVRAPIGTHVPGPALVERGRVQPFGVSSLPGFASILFCRHLDLRKSARFASRGDA
jgi:hypothetical protein